MITVLCRLGGGILAQEISKFQSHHKILEKSPKKWLSDHDVQFDFLVLQTILTKMNFKSNLLTDYVTLG